MAPAVNRQPGHPREPRRAPYTGQSAQNRSRLIKSRFPKILIFDFFDVHIGSVPGSQLSMKCIGGTQLQE
eukprot:4908501-Pyramimonas_sp.AAC.1